MKREDRQVNLFICATTAFLLLFSVTAYSQTGTTSSDRGAKLGNSYSIGEFDTINTTNGNLMFNFPLGVLPKGRGAASAGLVLRYNSKLYDSKVQKIRDWRYPNCSYIEEDPEPQECRYFHKTVLEQSDKGGWKYSYSRYELEIENRFDSLIGDQPNCRSGLVLVPNSYWMEQTYIHKLYVVSPDGSRHEMIPSGYTDSSDLRDKFYRVTHDGYVENCGGSRSRTGHPMTYYSEDGSFLRLEFSYDNDGDPNSNTWTLYFPDGSKVTSGGYSSGVNHKLYDRNGNYVEGLTDQLGRSVTISQNVNGDDEIRSKGVDGEEITWIVKWKNILVKKTYQSCNDGDGSCPTEDWRSDLDAVWPVVDTITEPAQMGGRTYTFNYNAHPYPDPPSGLSTGWGEVSSVTLPSGAEIDYTYAWDGEDGPPYFDQTKDLLKNYPTSKTLTHEGGTETWGYSTSYLGGSTIEPSGASTVNWCHSTEENNWQAGLTYKSESTNGSKTEKIWAQNVPASQSLGIQFAGNPYIKTEFTSIKDAVGNYSLTSIQDYTYDKNGNVTEVREYDWMPYGDIPRTGAGEPSLPTGLPTGAASYLKRITKTAYYNDTPEASSTTYTDPDGYHLSSNKRLLRLPKSVTVLNASQVTKSRTDLIYDHTDYDSSNTVAGNPTITRTWDSTKGVVTSPLTDGNSVKTQATYNSYGMPLSTTDAKEIVTQITYGNVSGPSGTVTDLYPTQTVVAYGTSLARTSTAIFDFYTGLVTSTTDEDNDLTNTVEYDDLGRPVKAITADGEVGFEAWTVTAYHDEDRYVVVNSDLEAVGDGKKVAIQHFDQLGRVRLSRTLENAAVEDPANEQHGIKVETRYKTVAGYTYQLTSNPFRAATSAAASTEPTMGWTLSTAWSNGRRSEVETFSGSGLPTVFGGGNTSSTGIVRTDIDVNRTLVTDQAGKRRMSVSNALGQLKEVWEILAASETGSESVSFPNTSIGHGFKTTYQYNTLGKMVRVQQGVQDRYFMYDSLGRMLRVKQPEQDVNTGLNTSGNPDNNSWTAGFTYDNNGNVLTATDAKGMTITNVYDAINRVTQRSYNDSPQTPTVNFYYDGTGLPSVPDFSKGKLTRVSSSISESRYTEFDVAGRLLEYKQITDGQTYTSEYEYNLSGALVKETYPSGREVRNEFDPSGDIERIFGKANQSESERTYANSFSYFADGRIEKLKLGNGLWEAAKINSRGQVTEFTLGHGPTSGNLWKNNYEYGESSGGTVDGTKNSGNIGKQTVTFNGLAHPFVQTYQYDKLYRLTEARETSNSTQTWKQTFGYDRYGNRTSHNKWFGATPESFDEITHPEIDDTTNRFASTEGYAFDANGNIVVDAQGRQFAFNGDNKQTQVKDDQNTVVGTYYFDGEGKRLKKVVGNETTVFVYSGSKLIAEYSTETPPQNPTTSYTITDQLGSPRVIVDALGQVISRRDFLPFGEEIDPDGTYRTTDHKFGIDDRVRQKFTGYQKDEETDLDFAEARMYQNLHGRFTAVDPLLASGKSADPQTFNRYVYVMNNPLLFVDPEGLQAATAVWVRGPQGHRDFVTTRGGRPRGGGWERFSGTENVRSTNGSVQRVTPSGFVGVGWHSSNPIPSQGISTSVTPTSPDTRTQDLVEGVGNHPQALALDRVTNPDGVSVNFNAPLLSVGGSATVTRDMDLVLSYTPIGLSPTDMQESLEYNGGSLRRFFTPARLAGGLSANATYIVNEPEMDRNQRLSFFTGASFNNGACFRLCVGVTATTPTAGEPPRAALNVGVGSPGITSNVSIGTCVSNLRGEEACPNQ